MSPLVGFFLVLAAAAPVPPAPILIEPGTSTTLGRHLCGTTGGEHVKVEDGRLVVPEQATPEKLSVQVGEGEDCAAPLTLSVTVVPAFPRPPVVAWVYPEEGRVAIRGAAARASVWWRIAGAFRSEACVETIGLDGAPGCAFSIPLEDARAAMNGAPLELLRLPPSTPAPEGAGAPELWTAPGGTGAPLELDALRVSVQRFVVSGPLLRTTSVEAWREQSAVPLAVPGAVTAVVCRPAGCWLSDDQGAVLLAPPSAGDSVMVTARLRDRVAVRQADGYVTGTLSQVLPVARCQLRPLVPTVLAGAEDHRLPLELGDRCPSDLEGLAVETSPASASYVAHVSGDGRRIELRLGRVPRRVESLEIRLLRAATRALVGTARVEVRSDFAPQPVTLSDAVLGEVPFIPTNREVQLTWAVADRKLGRFIVPQPAPGYYSLRREKGETFVRGLLKTAGTIPIRFAYVDPASGSDEPLAEFDSETRFGIRPANVPVPLSPGNARTASLFAVLCKGGKDDAEKEIAPGQLTSLPYAARKSCRLRVDRRTLTEADGTQRIKVSVKITSASGSSRSGGFSRVLVLVADGKTDSIWLGADEQLRSYDHLQVSIAHDDLQGFYLGGEDAASLPSRRYEMVFGDAFLRLYGSATVPTGLYRVTRGSDSGLLQFSAGALFRLAILDREGHEFPGDIELGLLGTNLSGHADFSIVAGVGLTVPLLNAQELAQAALGIHAWVEYSPTRSDDWKRPWAVIIGPSVSLGDIGINL